MDALNRRFGIIWILCRKRHETLVNLSQEFGVSVRTIQRDINVIGNKVPIYIKSGRYEGGVYIMEHYQVPCRYFTNDERSLLRQMSQICRPSLKQSDLEVLDGIMGQCAGEIKSSLRPARPRGDVSRTAD